MDFNFNSGARFFCEKPFDEFMEEMMRREGGGKLFKETIVQGLVSRIWNERKDKSTTETIKDVAAAAANNNDEIPKMHSFPPEKKDDITLPLKKREVSQNLGESVETCETSNQKKNHKRKRPNTSPSNSDEKKKKKVKISQAPSRPLPDRLRQHIEGIGGTDIKFIIQKKIYEADIVPRNNRISIPKTQLKDFSFLTEAERYFILHKDEREEGDKMLVRGYDCPGLRIRLLMESSMEESVQYFKTYCINTYNYVVTCNWNKLVNRHRHVLKVGETVQFWSFRKPAHPENQPPKIVKHTPLMESNLCVVLVVL